MAASSMPTPFSAENRLTLTSACSGQASRQQRLGAAQGLRRGAARELVRLGQQHQQPHRAAVQPRRDQLQQLPVQVGEAQARIDHQHHARQAAALRQVLRHDLLPAQLGGALHGRIAIARQVDEERVGRVLRPHREQVDVLRAPGRARREGQALLLGQAVDGSGLAGVAAPDEGDLRQVGRRQLVQPCGRGQETGAVGPGQGRLGGGLVGADWRWLRCGSSGIVKSDGFAPQHDTKPRT